MSPASRTRAGWAASGLAVVAVFAAIGILGEGLAPAPTGPTGSALATSPGGLAAYAALLARDGHPVVPLRAPLRQAALSPEATVVVAAAPALAAPAARRLRQFVDAGGTLLLAGGRLDANARQVLPDPPRWSPLGPAAPQTSHPTPPAGRSLGVEAVLTTGSGGWADPGVGELIARPSGGALLLERNLGRGRVALLGSASPLENALLARADNAQLGLALAGSPRRPVLFAEAMHAPAPAAGLAALPSRWWVTLAGLGLAGLVWAISRGRRLGPVEPTPPPPPPARSAYVDAIATLLVRSDDPDGLAALRDPEPVNR